MSLSFDPISSPDAKRDVFVDLSGALEPEEVLTVATIESSYPVALTISNVAVSENVVVVDDRETPIGRGLHFTINTLQESRSVVPITIKFEGDLGTVDKYELKQPVLPTL